MLCDGSSSETQDARRQLLPTSANADHGRLGPQDAKKDETRFGFPDPIHPAVDFVLVLGRFDRNVDLHVEPMRNVKQKHPLQTGDDSREVG